MHIFKQFGINVPRMTLCKIPASHVDLSKVCPSGGSAVLPYIAIEKTLKAFLRRENVANFQIIL